ncbi:pksN [Symbiodinium sp. CCMP2456]|nr:pksN [Symbiodinium sp. CCMP2456]
MLNATPCLRSFLWINSLIVSARVLMSHKCLECAVLAQGAGFMPRRSQGDGHGRAPARDRGRGTGADGGALVLQDGATMGEFHFRFSAGSEFDYLVFEVLGERFEKLGLAVGEVKEKYEVNSAGMFVDLVCLGIDNRYALGGASKMKAKLAGCQFLPIIFLASRCSKNFGMQDVIRAQKWAQTSGSAVVAANCRS